MARADTVGHHMAADAADDLLLRPGLAVRLAHGRAHRPGPRAGGGLAADLTGRALQGQRALILGTHSQPRRGHGRRRGAGAPLRPAAAALARALAEPLPDGDARGDL